MVWKQQLCLFPECQVVLCKTAVVNEGRKSPISHQLAWREYTWWLFNKLAGALVELLKITVQKAFHEIQLSTLPSVWRSFSNWCSAVGLSYPQEQMSKKRNSKLWVCSNQFSLAFHWVSGQQERWQCNVLTFSDKLKHYLHSPTACTV